MKRFIPTPKSTDSQSGFTIVELMIATVAFSLILLVITYGVLSFTHAYYAGVNRSTTQDTTRSVVGTISQAIQFSGSPIVGTDATGSSYFCAGNQIFTFDPGEVYKGGTPGPNNFGLYVIPVGAGGCPSTAPASYVGGKELLAPNMRVTSLSVQSVSSRLYSVDLTLALGGSDQLCTPAVGVTGSCQGPTPYSPTAIVQGNDIRCKQQAGSQFCAVSRLSSTVSLRVASSDLTD